MSAGGPSFEGATPHHLASFTPNPLAMPLRDEVALTSTPSLATPLKTPLRDNILVNVDNTGGNNERLPPPQTPLLGQENTPRHTVSAGGPGIEGATPHHQANFTPNPLATPLRDEVALTSTPSLATPLKTPLRDNVLVNVDNTGGNNHAGVCAAPYPY